MTDTQARKYQQIAAVLRRQIHSGQLPPDAPLPTENELMTAHQVSRWTVREAVRVLADEHLITSVTGQTPRVRRQLLLTINLTREESRCALLQDVRGRPVRQQPTPGADSWQMDILGLGHTPGEEVRVAVAAPGSQAAQLLGDPQAEPPVLREVTRSVDGTRHNVQRWVFPRAVTSDAPLLLDPADIPQGSIAYLRGCGYALDDFTVEFLARPPVQDATEAGLLQLPAGVQVIDELRTGLAGGEPVLACQTLWRADQTRLRVRFST